MILAKLYRNDTALILIAIALGLSLGILRPELAVQMKPLSDAFLDVIGHAVPLVMFVLVASAVSAFGKRGQHTRCAGRVVVYFLMMAVFSLIGACAPGWIRRARIQPARPTHDRPRLRDRGCARRQVRARA